jgi:hypothetical protein
MRQAASSFRSTLTCAVELPALFGVLSRVRCGMHACTVPRLGEAGFKAAILGGHSSLAAKQSKKNLKKAFLKKTLQLV